jgi:uncharacterized protein (TIGR00725 family)
LSTGLTVAVFGSSQTDPSDPEWRDAEQAGTMLAEAGHGVITGGYGGTMEAASKGASEAGGHVIGVIAPSLFAERSGANRFVAENIEAETLTGRIEMVLERSSAVLVMPGSIGTATELCVVWNLNHIERRGGVGPHRPTAAVGSVWGHFGRLLAESAGANPVDIHWSETATDGVTWILDQIH